MSFVFYNPNSKNIKTSDCVVRALCKATGFGWIHVHKELCDESRELGLMPGDIVIIESFLKRHFSNVQKLNVRNPDNTRLRVKDLVGNKTIVCRCANHIVTFQDNNYFDLFDSGNKSVYKAWVI
jgi:hypothetical protein